VIGDVKSLSDGDEKLAALTIPPPPSLAHSLLFAEVDMPNTAPSLDAPSAAPSPEAERRRFVRYCCAPYPRVRSLVQPEMQFREGLLKDVSTRGLCLILDDAPGVGKGLVVQLPGRQRGTSLCRVVQVKHVESDYAGRWLVGCEIRTALSNEQLRLLAEEVQALSRRI
jgi:hypothetical protein